MCKHVCNPSVIGAGSGTKYRGMQAYVMQAHMDVLSSTCKKNFQPTFVTQPLELVLVVLWLWCCLCSLCFVAVTATASASQETK